MNMKLRKFQKVVKPLPKQILLTSLCLHWLTIFAKTHRPDRRFSRAPNLLMSFRMIMSMRVKQQCHCPWYNLWRKFIVSIHLKHRVHKCAFVHEQQLREGFIMTHLQNWCRSFICCVTQLCYVRSLLSQSQSHQHFSSSYFVMINIFCGFHQIVIWPQLRVLPGDNLDTQLRLIMTHACVHVCV